MRWNSVCSSCSFSLTCNEKAEPPSRLISVNHWSLSNMGAPSCSAGARQYKISCLQRTITGNEYGLYRQASVFIVAAMTWNRDDARQQYNISGWSAGYFDVSEDGQLVARPAGSPDSPTVDLHALAHTVRDAGLSWPVLVRFTDILHQQVDRLCGAFEAAINATTTRRVTPPSIPSRSTSSSTWWMRSCGMAANASVLRQAASRSCWRSSALHRPTASLSATATRTRNTFAWRCMAQRLGHRVTLVIEKLSELELIIRWQQR